MKKSRGFTIPELLITVAIIGVLTSIVVASLNKAKANSRDNKRRQDMLAIQAALEMYYFDNGSYPVANYYGVSVGGGSRTTSGVNAYIPGLTPNYMTVLPTDPSGSLTDYSGYLYVSDGAGYKLIDHWIGPESFPAPPAPGSEFYDPYRPTWAWMLCSEEPYCSDW